jgi:hypothetical protein
VLEGRESQAAQGCEARERRSSLLRHQKDH